MIEYYVETRTIHYVVAKSLKGREIDIAAYPEDELSDAQRLATDLNQAKT